MEEMSDQMYEQLMKLPKANLINLMWGALDNMQASNGRTRVTCIMMALGAEGEETPDGAGMRWRWPKPKDMKQITDSMGF